MTTVTRSQTIARPPAEVWAALADFGALATWAPNVDHSCLLRAGEGATEGDAVALGTERRVQTGRTTLIERVTTSEEPTALGYAITGLPPVVRSVTNEWHLTPRGDATAVTLTSTIDCGPRPPQQLIARIVGRRLGQESDSLLTGLAARLEGTTHV